MGMLERIKAGVNNTRTVPFLEEHVTLRVLSEAELQQCRAGAEKDRERLSLDDETIGVETVLRQLYRSASDSEGKQLADTFDRFKELVTRYEREYLVKEYLELEADCSPKPDMFTDEQFETLLDDVKKNPELIFISSSTDLLRKLVRYLEAPQRR